MRLLHTTQFRFKQHFEHNRPPYAILSHCWSLDPDDEVSYDEFNNAFHLELAGDRSRLEGRSGLSKIFDCCKVAAQREIEWVWIDTCCIDKRSSSELSEAINSMYRWYQEAVECYVYLDGLDSTATSVKLRREFQSHRWFTRGWTLQELLAPKSLGFYDHHWKFIGDRSKFKEEISAASRIAPKHMGNPPDACIAVKMSWAANRQTSRPEDIAYCLLGIFNVNMPLLYGEGAVKAFLRLQLEIISKSDDESIFAWTSKVPRVGMLARSPAHFEDSGNIETKRSRLEARQPYSMTNKGLLFNVPTKYTSRHPAVLHEDKLISLSLTCGRWDEKGNWGWAVIYLRRNQQTWFRVDAETLPVRDELKRSYDGSGNSQTRIIYVLQEGL